MTYRERQRLADIQAAIDAEVGRAVTRFRVGDWVLGHAVGTDKDSNRAAEGGFQLYTAMDIQLKGVLAAKIVVSLP